MPSEFELAPPEVRYDRRLLRLVILLTDWNRALWTALGICDRMGLTPSLRMLFLSQHPSWATIELLRIQLKCIDINHQPCPACRPSLRPTTDVEDAIRGEATC